MWTKVNAFSIFFVSHVFSNVQLCASSVGQNQMIVLNFNSLKIILSSRDRMHTSFSSRMSKTRAKTAIPAKAPGVIVKSGASRNAT
ncbi:MAG: competence protein ComK [Desulfovibrionaceae bacterium]|nr:competence protein ComK [Desulfovibrionaceae bacterium]